MRLLLASLLVLPAVARGERSPWFDPALGCGSGAAFSKSGKVADLPGCTGRIPKNAPEVEVVLREAKRRLEDAEELLAKDKLDKLDALLAAVQADLQRAPPIDPELPDRWEQSLPLYQRAIASLKNRRKLAPHLEKLRSAHRAAVETAAAKGRAEIEGGPAESLKAAQACLAVFSETRASGVDLDVEVELEKGQARTLQAALAECDQLRRSAEALARAQEKAAKAKRAQLRRQLKGDRLKTFDAHPSALPQLEGAAADSKNIAKAAVWKFATATGVEVYTFKGNKLINHSVAAK
jgi:hypothetical protein